MEAWQIRDAGSGIDVQARLQLTRGGLLMEGRAELEYPLVVSLSKGHHEREFGARSPRAGI